jgi:hypothetical protein
MPDNENHIPERSRDETHRLPMGMILLQPDAHMVRGWWITTKKMETGTSARKMSDGKSSSRPEGPKML